MTKSVQVLHPQSVPMRHDPLALEASVQTGQNTSDVIVYGGCDVVSGFSLLISSPRPTLTIPQSFSQSIATHHLAQHGCKYTIDFATGTQALLNERDSRSEC